MRTTKNVLKRLQALEESVSAGYSCEEEVFLLARATRVAEDRGQLTPALRARVTAAIEAWREAKPRLRKWKA